MPGAVRIIREAVSQILERVLDPLGEFRLVGKRLAMVLSERLNEIHPGAKSASAIRLEEVTPEIESGVMPERCERIQERPVGAFCDQRRVACQQGHPHVA